MNTSTVRFLALIRWIQPLAKKTARMNAWVNSKDAVTVASLTSVVFILLKLRNYKIEQNKQFVNLKAAANAILNADFCLLATGAGFSADSGLKVFKDIANINVYKRHNLKYNDLSRPNNIKKIPLIVYGFWFWCYNTYKNAIPHNGYYIIKKWKEKYFNKNKSIQSFWCLTSNVDHLHIKAGFNPNEIDAIHGDMIYWQCSKRCCNKSWKFEENHRFLIDEKTLLPINKSEFKPPKCKYCLNAEARPAIEMFDDRFFVGRNNRIDKWRNNVIKLCNEEKQESMKLVIIEIGAGITIPSIRHHCEGLIQLIKNSTLIRCNIEFDNIPIRKNTLGQAISIKMNALQFIQSIDKILDILTMQQSI